jgi:tetratricopeptide (TPR) repeat protein
MYRQILAVDPRHALAMHNLGLVAQKVGRADLAVKWLQGALAQDPGDPSLHFHLGQAYATLRCTEEAIACFQIAVKMKPDLIDARNDLGAALIEAERFDEAEEVFRGILAIQPRYVFAHSNLASIFTKKGRMEEAAAACRRALEIEPGYLDAQTNLVSALLALNQIKEALAVSEVVGRARPDDALALSNWGCALRANGRLEEALTLMRRALELRPDKAEYHWNAALTLLGAGQFKEGWEEYEWRTKLPHLARPDLTAPPWQGEDLAGRTLLIHQEGGFGDVIQFIRYLPMIRARRATGVVFEGRAPMLSLMQMQPGVDAVVERGQRLPAHDFQCAPQSLPRLFGTELQTIPAEVPYLLVDAEKRSAWRQRLAGPPYQEGGKRPFFVGLCWAGSEQANDFRSRTLEVFAPLAEVEGVTFLSLQKGAAAGSMAGVSAGLNVVDAAAAVEDFSDLAALVSCVDVVASVDTAVAHLGGALGIPTWILIPRNPDCRWLIQREDSPWYPTVRLFRQERYRDWEGPMRRMAEELRWRVS